MLKEFKIALSRTERGYGCPHNCHQWARLLGPAGDMVTDEDGVRHHYNCPEVNAERAKFFDQFPDENGD